MPPHNCQPAVTMMKYIPAFALAALLGTAIAQDTKAPAAAAPAAGDVKALTPEVHKGTEKRHESFNEISKKGEAQVVFLGDSITHGWDGHKAVWDASFGPMKPANFGIGGDRTEHVLWRIDNGNFDGIKPKVVVLMIGTNNTGHRMDPAADTAAGIKEIIARIHAKSADTKVLLLAIFPRGEKPDDKMRVRNSEINAIIKGYDDGKKVFFLDIGSKFLTADGTLTKEIMPDLLHLSPKGYQIWADSIKDKLAELAK